MPEKKNILILGCGWLGTALGKQLNVTGHSVIGTTTHKSRERELAEAGIKPLLLQFGNQQDESPPVLPATDIVILLMNPGAIWPIRKMIGKMIEVCGAGMLIMASSTTIYPEADRLVREEDAEFKPSPHSGIVLLSMEEHFRHLNKVSTVILRFSGLYGPGREPGRFMLNKGQLSAPDSPVNMVHQEDCVRAIIAVIDGDVQKGVFNICADEHPSRKDFYTAAAKSAGLKPPVFSEGKSARKIVDNSAFKKAFAFRYLHADPMDDLI